LLVGRGLWRGPGPRAPRPAGRAGWADLRRCSEEPTVTYGPSGTGTGTGTFTARPAIQEHP